MRRSFSLACVVALLVCSMASSGCLVMRQAPPPGMQADLDRLADDLNLMPPMPRPPKESGSLWTESGPGAALARDTRAYRINDLLTVSVVERSIGDTSSGTDLDRSSSASYGAPVAFGLEDANPSTGSFNLNNVLTTDSSSEFKGDGKTTRSNTLAGTITTRVMRVLPNGDLLIGGQKNVMINREQQILTMVGTVRPVDINSANVISSAQVGDLTVRLWGKGEIDSTTRQGWFMKIMNRIWPF